MQRPTVFISYSHDSDEHRERVLGLSERLREDGIDTILDRYVNGKQDEGWPRWMMNQLDKANRVVVVCTETYHRRFRGHEEPGKGKGADWEGTMITQEMYDAKSSTNKFIPVAFGSAALAHIPEPLRGQTYYVIDSEAAYGAFYDDLLEQSGVEPGELGELKRKPQEKARPLSFASDGREGDNEPRVDISRIIKYAPPKLIGRKTETALLGDAWRKVTAHEEGRPHVLGFVALGGEGKTSLVAKWLAGMAGQDVRVHSLRA